VLEETVGQERRRALASLTPREAEVLQLVARGLANAEVAGKLEISIHAVKFHLASIYSRLGVANRTEAAVTHLRYGDGWPTAPREEG
jgi:DNA-binding NarL/FixJ family response regulator